MHPILKSIGYTQGSVGERMQVARVAEVCTEPAPACLLDVQRMQIDEVDVVAACGEPLGVQTRPPSDVEDARRWRRQHVVEQLQRPDELQAVAAVVDEAVALDAVGVVALEVRVHYPNPYSPAKRSARRRTSTDAGRPTTFR